VVECFGLPRERARTCLPHGLLSRGIALLDPARRFEPPLHRWFSRWAARAVSAGGFHRVHCFSGVAEELFLSLDGQVKKSLVRGSAHIDLQSQLLTEEQTRAGRPIEVPSAWMIAREKREYALADEVVVLSRFAWQSFRDQGFPEDKLRLLPLGAELLRFRAEPDVIQRRCERILSRRPLRVLIVGTFSFQKGALDLVQIARELAGQCEFRFVGGIAREASALRREASGLIEFVPRQSEHRLPLAYEWGDVFLFPTIQDGYAVVLAQAQAAGLPVLTTTNCAGPDFVFEGETGWILPIRDPRAFVERLKQCGRNRESLAANVRAVHEKFQPRDWKQVAEDFIRPRSGRANDFNS
jgi:glycosyltransferase involved in cell wall biosynthesis